MVSLRYNVAPVFRGRVILDMDSGDETVCHDRQARTDGWGAGAETRVPEWSLMKVVVHRDELVGASPPGRSHRGPGPHVSGTHIAEEVEHHEFP